VLSGESTMAVSGIGLQSSTQFVPRSKNGGRDGTQDVANNKLSSKASTNELQRADTNSPVQSKSTQETRFDAVPQAANTYKSTTSRKDLTQVEASRNRFQLQQNDQKSQGRSAKALQSFLDVADFERKDDLTKMVGIDIFI